MKAENLPRILSECRALGNQFLFVASLPPEQRGQLDSYKRAAELFNAMGRSTREEGVQFGFHNEAWELTALDGVVPLDYLIEHTDRQWVHFQIDAANLVKGGGAPVAYLERLRGRVESIHLKDVNTNGEATALGTGVVPLREVLRAATQAGVTQFVVEDLRRGLGYSHVESAFAVLRDMQY